MLYITGDTHGDKFRFTEGEINDEHFTKDDYIIICGDFGYIFHNDSEENNFLDYLETKPYSICFCDGNHENFKAIYSYPKEKWNGGYVHKIRSNIFHLMRGEVYEIEKQKIFTMGGAYSIDRYSRKLNYSYWKEELPSNEEYHNAVNNLKTHNNSVDIIITHTAPKKIIYRMGSYPDNHDLELTGFLDWIFCEVDFKNWYFGHWHKDKKITDKITAVYTDVICHK